MRYAKINFERTTILEWRNLNSHKLLRMSDQSQKLNPKHQDFLDAGWLSEEVESISEFKNIGNPFILTNTIIYIPTYKTFEECQEILRNKIKTHANQLISNAYNIEFKDTCIGEEILYSRFIDQNIESPKVVYEYFVKQIVNIKTNYLTAVGNLKNQIECENFDYLSNWDEVEDFNDLTPELALNSDTVNIWTKIKQSITDSIINVFDDPQLK